MADAQGNSSSSSTLDSLSSVDVGTEVKHYLNPETGGEFFHDKEQEGDEEGEGGGGGGGGGGDDDDDDDDDEDEEDEYDEEEEAKLNSAAAKAQNPFQVSNCPWMQYSRRAEIRRILQALRGELDENENKRCTHCKAMGHVCLDCPLPIRFKPRVRGHVPQQNPMQPNEAHSPGKEQATIPSKGGCTGSTSQEVALDTAVPSVSSASASQLGKSKSESGCGTGSPTRKL